MMAQKKFATKILAFCLLTAVLLSQSFLSFTVAQSNGITVLT